MRWGVVSLWIHPRECSHIGILHVKVVDLLFTVWAADMVCIGPSESHGIDVSMIWSNYSDLTRPGPPNGGLVREFPLFQGNLGWWNIIIWPEWFSKCKMPLLGPMFCQHDQTFCIDYMVKPQVQCVHGAMPPSLREIEKDHIIVKIRKNKLNMLGPK